jgi:hypothetical protein
MWSLAKAKLAKASSSNSSSRMGKGKAKGKGMQGKEGVSQQGSRWWQQHPGSRGYRLLVSSRCRGLGASRTPGAHLEGRSRRPMIIMRVMMSWTTAVMMKEDRAGRAWSLGAPRGQHLGVSSPSWTSFARRLQVSSRVITLLTGVQPDQYAQTRVCEALTPALHWDSAGDDVEAEFAAEKAAEIEGELPKVEEVGALPGWGVWADQQKEPRWVKEQKEKQAR